MATKEERERIKVHVRKFAHQLIDMDVASKMHEALGAVAQAMGFLDYNDLLDSPERWDKVLSYRGLSEDRKAPS